jgi:DNA-binding FadR family transcriptional regulator
MQVFTLAEQIACQIKNSILDGFIKPGEQLPAEHELSNLFGVSRPTIRQALDLLCDQKILTVRRGRSGGHFVDSRITEKCLSSLSQCLPIFDLKPLSLEELKEARDIIQVKGSELAVERRSKEDLTRIYSSIPFTEGLYCCDFAMKLVNFQIELVKASYNRTLIANMNSIARNLRIIFLKMNMGDEIKKAYLENMENIYECLAQQDSLKVTSCMKSCLNYCNGVIEEARGRI